MVNRNFTGVAVGLAGYVGLLFLANQIAPQISQGFAVQAGLALLPIAAAIVVMWFMIRAIRALDEMHKAQQFEGMAIGFGASLLFCLTWGFMEDAGAPRIDTYALIPIMTGFWVIGIWIAGRRFR